MANAIEQKVDVSRAVGDLRLTAEQKPDPPEGKKPHSDNPGGKWPNTAMTQRATSRIPLVQSSAAGLLCFSAPLAARSLAWSLPSGCR